ncbi:protein Aster-B-like, partial [Saccoglossus kowalevskii]|uniref:GRAM domain-containing protein 1B-like n=1 Tax=Saccoglossus kowalevskii TaxID=10224 RepID=A0ABM0M2I5_SACKO
MTTISQKTLLELVKENDRDTGSDGERHSSEETTMEEKQNNEATTATPPQTIPTPSGSGDERPATPPSTASKSDLPILREDITDESTQSLDDSTAHPQSRMSPEASKDYFSRSFDDISVLDKSDKSSSNEKIPDMSSSKGEKDGSKSGKGSNKKSSNISWYNVWNTSYKAKCEDFRKIFGKHIPDTERLVVDYSCALQKDILVHGRLYLTQNWLCFYANIFRWETLITVKCKDVTAITKERTARVIPNAIQLCTHTEKYFFTSFASRDKTFMILFRLWQNALLDQAMSPQDFWTWVRMNYGDEVGMDSEEVIEPYNAGTPNDSRDEGASDGSISMENGIVNRKAGQALSLPLEKQDLSPESPSNRGMTNDSLQDSSSFLQTPSYAADESSLNTTESECIIQPQEISMGTPPVKLSPEKSTKTQTKALPSPSVNDRGIFGQKDKDKTSDNLPTDESDFTEGEGEVICPCTEHPGRKCVSEVYDFPVDILFDMLFADKHTFYKDFLEARKTTNIVMFSWQDVDNNKMVRTMTYTLTLFASFGPKTAESTEVQTTYKDVCKEGQLYVVDTEVVNHGIPYGDNFYVANRYCLTRVSSTQSRL